MCVFTAAIQINCRVGPAQVNREKAETIAVIPRPVKMELHEGQFTLTPKTTIFVTKDTHHVGEYLSELLRPATGFNFNVRQDSSFSKGASCIVLRTISNKNHLGTEGYELKVMKDRVLVYAQSPAGVFYACQSLRQLLPTAIESKEKVQGVAWTMPCVEIEDKPRFQWRGLMMDCSRTFWPKEYIKRYIDLLAYHKLNVFHLHLTDDQGWRVEIKKHPKLTTIGSKFASRYKGERNGYYSQKDIKEIVNYAASRYVTVVPEIEMPGHCLAALTGYPELSCTGGPFEIYPYFEGPGIQENVFCAGNDKTFALLEDVLDEVVELFPGEYVHIGGDECPKGRWKRCAKCQARIKAEGLKDEHELQSYFIKRIEKFLNSKNRKLIGWDEILEGGLAPNATVMSWRGTKGGIAAARAGHDVIMSPYTHCYFDMRQSDSPQELGATWAEPVFLKKVYSYEPVPSDLTLEQARHILGAQGNMWTHIARNEEAVDRQIFPRLVALSEVVWSPKESKEWSDFRNRLRVHCGRLDKLAVNFHRTPVTATSLCGNPALALPLLVQSKVANPRKSSISKVWSRPARKKRWIKIDSVPSRE